jgi:hypothetical protein
LDKKKDGVPEFEKEKIEQVLAQISVIDFNARFLADPHTLF